MNELCLFIQHTHTHTMSRVFGWMQPSSACPTFSYPPLLVWSPSFLFLFCERLSLLFSDTDGKEHEAPQLLLKGNIKHLVPHLGAARERAAVRIIQVHPRSFFIFWMLNNLTWRSRNSWRLLLKVQLLKRLLYHLSLPVHFGLIVFGCVL